MSGQRQSWAGSSWRTKKTRKRNGHDMVATLYITNRAIKIGGGGGSTKYWGPEVEGLRPPPLAAAPEGSRLS